MKTYTPAYPTANILDALLDPRAIRNRSNPRIFFREIEKGLLLEAELPGYEPGKIDISLDRAVFQIKGEKVDFAGDPLTFERRFELPYTPAPDAIKAEFRNGLLRVTIPQPESAVQTKIAITVA